MMSNRARQRGIATMLAIGLALLVAVTLTMLSIVFTTHAKRTRVQADDAQLRQYLLAGALVAQVRLNEQGPAVFADPSAFALPASDATLTLQRAETEPATDLRITIKITTGTRHAEQTLVFRESEGRWQAADVDTVWFP